MGEGIRCLMNEEPLILLIADLAVADGVAPVRDKVWTRKLDKHWTIAVNGYGSEQSVNLTCPTKIPACSVLIEFNGWPAGMLNLLGEGSIAAGEAANQATLREAIMSALRSKRGAAADFHG